MGRKVILWGENSFFLLILATSNHFYIFVAKKIIAIISNFIQNEKNLFTHFRAI